MTKLKVVIGTDHVGAHYAEELRDRGDRAGPFGGPRDAADHGHFRQAVVGQVEGAVMGLQSVGGQQPLIEPGVDRA